MAVKSFQSSFQFSSIIAFLLKILNFQIHLKMVEMSGPGPHGKHLGGKEGSGGGGYRGRGGRGGRGGRQLGPRHSTALEGSCYIHHQFGVEAWSCADRHSCPMRDIENPKPKHNRNIPIEK